jgi:hypothetical protein
MGVKVTLVSDQKNRISINSQNRTQIKTVAITPDLSGLNSSLASLSDVDASDPDNNETLVYDDTTGKYVVKTLPNINGGTF